MSLYAGLFPQISSTSLWNQSSLLAHGSNRPNVVYTPGLQSLISPCTSVSVQPSLLNSAPPSAMLCPPPTGRTRAGRDTSAPLPGGRLPAPRADLSPQGSSLTAGYRQHGKDTVAQEGPNGRMKRAAWWCGPPRNPNASLREAYRYLTSS